MSLIHQGAEWIGRALRKLREVGFAYAFALGMRRVIPARLLSTHELVVLRLPTNRSTDRTSGVDSAVGRWAMPEDQETLRQFGHVPEELAHRRERGDRAWILVESDRLLGYCWFTKHDYLDVDSGLEFPGSEHEVWLYDAMVERACRGRGIYPRILSGAARQLAKEETRAIWIIVDRLNRNSIRAHEAAGAEIQYHARVWNVLGFRIERRPDHRGLDHS